MQVSPEISLYRYRLIPQLIPCWPIWEFFIIVQRRGKRDGTSKVISFSPSIAIKSPNLNLEFVCACSNHLLWLSNLSSYFFICPLLNFNYSNYFHWNYTYFLRIPSKTHVEFGDKYIESKDFILLHKLTRKQMKWTKINCLLAKRKKWVFIEEIACRHKIDESIPTNKRLWSEV